jgi:hypothetical protein
MNLLQKLNPWIQPLLLSINFLSVFKKKVIVFSHDITDILMKVVLNTITLTLYQYLGIVLFVF